VSASKRNILLIWTSFDIPNVNFLPIGYGYIASNMGSAYEVELLDYALRGFSEDDLLHAVKLYDPIVIGVSLWEINFKNVQNIVSLVKKHFPKAIVVIGGPSASTRANGALDMIDADFAIQGEGERSLEMLCDIVASDRLNDTERLNTVPGIVYYNTSDKKYISKPIQPLDLRGINYPDYEKIRVREYIRKGYTYGYFSKDVKNLPIITTRGCPYSCNYCSARYIHGREIRTRLVKDITDEIAFLYDRYSIRGINIIDDNFTFNKDFVIEFCTEIENRKDRLANLHIGTPNGVRVEKLGDTVLKNMKMAGWEYIAIAPESGSESTLRRMNKKISLKQVVDQVSRIQKFGFRVFAFFIIGYPGETTEDVMKTIHFACSLPFDQITFSPFNPLPGTPVYDALLKSGEIDPGYSSANYFNITFSPSGMMVSELKRLHRYALYRSILLSPRRLLFFVKAYSFRRVFNYTRFYFQKNAAEKR